MDEAIMLKSLPIITTIILKPYLIQLLFYVSS